MSTYRGIDSLNKSCWYVNCFGLIYRGEYCALGTKCDNHSSTTSLEQNGCDSFGFIHRCDSQSSDYFRLCLIETDYIHILTNIRAQVWNCRGWIKYRQNCNSINKFGSVISIKSTLIVHYAYKIQKKYHTNFKNALVLSTNNEDPFQLCCCYCNSSLLTFSMSTSCKSTERTEEIKQQLVEFWQSSNSVFD